MSIVVYFLIIPIIILTALLSRKLFEIIKRYISRVYHAWKSHKTRKETLSDKFDDLMYWKNGDVLDVSDYHYAGEEDYPSGTLILVSFKNDGVYTTGENIWKQYELGRMDKHQLSKWVVFVDVNSIKKNITAEERKFEEDFLNTIEDDTSYNNQLIIIQNEYQKLNSEFNLSNKVKE